MKEFMLKEDQIERLVDLNTVCIASDRITVDGMKVGYMYREEPDNEFDSGWRFFAGDEDEQYTNNPNNFEIYGLNTICNYDQNIIPYLTKPVGTRLDRIDEYFVEVND